MQETQISFKVDSNLKTAFEKAVGANDLNCSQVFRRFMADYVEEARDKDEYEAWFARKVQRGREQAAAGRTLTHAQVTEKAEQRRKRLLGDVS